MKKIYYDQLDEELYYEELENGLQVYLLPKPGFNKTYASFTTKYGSIDNEFIPLNGEEAKRVTDGIAHFLEHKMFEKEDGDVFQLFSKQGASANAFTSSTSTAYLFSSTTNVKENLSTLIDFVQEPYFSDESVEKEKGIINQEITMYDDNPDWRLYFGTINNLYKDFPVKIDIAGTVESISIITKEMLYECYETFYHPSNMILFVVGAIDPEEIGQLIRENQAEKSFQLAEPITRFFPVEQAEVAKKETSIAMNVQMPKALVGIKGIHKKESGAEQLKTELSVTILLDLLFGKSSSNYSKLTDEGLIDNSFSASYNQERGYRFAMVGGDSTEPERLAENLQEILLDCRNNFDFSHEELERAKRRKIGYFLRALNSPEFIANQFTRYKFNDMDLFEIVPTIESLKLDDLKEVAESLISDDRLTTCYIMPKEK